MLDPTVLRLVAITDDLRDGVAGLVARTAAAVRGGVTMVQLRLKETDARTLVEVGRALATLPVPLVVNDRLDVALACGAAGVHLGADDLPVAAARRIVPARFIVGASFGTADELENARAADYVGIGPVYETGSKNDAGAAIGPDGLARLSRMIALPGVAIGGITAKNAAAAVRAGAVGVAAIRAILSSRDPEAAARAFSYAIGT